MRWCAKFPACGGPKPQLAAQVVIDGWCSDCHARACDPNELGDKVPLTHEEAIDASEQGVGSESRGKKRRDVGKRKQRRRAGPAPGGGAAGSTSNQTASLGGFKKTGASSRGKVNVAQGVPESMNVAGPSIFHSSSPSTTMGSDSAEGNWSSSASTTSSLVSFESDNATSTRVPIGCAVATSYLNSGDMTVGTGLEVSGMAAGGKGGCLMPGTGVTASGGDSFWPPQFSGYYGGQCGGGSSFGTANGNMTAASCPRATYDMTPAVREVGYSYGLAGGLHGTSMLMMNVNGGKSYYIPSNDMGFGAGGGMSNVNQWGRADDGSTGGSGGGGGGGTGLY